MKPRQRNFYSCPKDQHGQAIVEYVLVLVVVVAIASLFLAKLIRPLDQYLQGSLGSYVQCLLETGELPTLGSDETTAASECGSVMAAVKGDFSSSVAAQAKLNNGESDPDGKNKNKSGNSQANSSATKSSSGGTYAGSASRRGGNRITRAGEGSEGLEGNPDQQEGSKSNSSTFRPPIQTQQNSENRTKVTEIPYDRLPDRLKRQLEEKQKVKNVGEVTSDGSAGSGPKRIPVSIPEKKEKKVESDLGFELGNYMRYFLIAAIIVIILLVVGGQMYSLSKEQ